MFTFRWRSILSHVPFSAAATIEYTSNFPPLPISAGCEMTTGNIINVAITYRPAFFSEPDIEGIKRDFGELLAQLEQ